MKILLATNSAERCGVAMYGRDLGESLRRRGHEVDLWLVDQENMPRPAMKPDLCIVNWMLGTIPAFGPRHVPAGIPVACYFHESYPYNNRERCPFWETADLIFVPEPVAPEGARRNPVCVFFPCPDEKPETLPFLPQNMLKVHIGLSGLRQEGAELLHQVTWKNDWELYLHDGGYRTSLPFYSRQEEVNRLGKCTLSAYLYGNSFGGQSSAVMTAIAARRPIVLTRARQFSTLFDHEDELYFAQPGDAPTVEKVIKKVLRDIKSGKEKRPLKLAEDRCWAKAAEVYEKYLLEILR